LREWETERERRGEGKGWSENEPIISMMLLERSEKVTIQVHGRERRKGCKQRQSSSAPVGYLAMRLISRNTMLNVLVDKSNWPKQYSYDMNSSKPQARASIKSYAVSSLWIFWCGLFRHCIVSALAQASSLLNPIEQRHGDEAQSTRKI
jgi:hypothetical protein